MSKKEFLLLLDELLEEDPGTLKGVEHLQDLDMWDSMSVLGFIALLDEKFGIIVSGNDLEKCDTINDLVKLVDKQVT